jgi:plastocyanin
VRLRLFVTSILVLVGVVTLNAMNGALPSSAAQAWTVRVGDGGQGISANGFLPGAIMIHSGDTIHFTNPYDEIHTVSSVPSGSNAPDLIVPGPSGPPQFGINSQAGYPSFTGTGVQAYDPTKFYNSGILNKGDAVDLSFATPGTYTVLCLVHGFIDQTTHKVVGMKLDITVVPQGSPGTLSQAAADAQGNAERDALIAQGLVAEAGFKLTSAKLPDGSTNWGATVGGYGDALGQADISRFTPGSISVNVGDTVTWTNVTQTPHTVTFLSGTPDIPLITPVPVTGGGAPFLAFTPAALLPAGGPTYDGTAYTNSGFIGKGGFPTNTYALKFTKAGTYEYICHLHDTQGMIGTITVSGVAAASVKPPATTPAGITAPNTGTGPVDGSQRGWLPSLLVLAVSGAVLVLFGAFERRRRHAA